MSGTDVAPPSGPVRARADGKLIRKEGQTMNPDLAAALLLGWLLGAPLVLMVIDRLRTPRPGLRLSP